MKKKTNATELKVLEDLTVLAYKFFRERSNELFTKDEQAWHDLQYRLYGSDEA